MNIVQVKPETLIPYARNPRKNTEAVAAVAASIKEFGFKQPIVVDDENVIIVGHSRHAAALQLGLDEVPIIIAHDLTPAQIKAYRILDNKSGEKAKWDFELLQLELGELDFNNEAFQLSFDQSELDVIMQASWTPPENSGESFNEKPSTPLDSIKAAPVVLTPEERATIEVAVKKMRKKVDDVDVSEGYILAMICNEWASDDD